MMADLFIPKKIRVGFQNRNGTYTGKLAYVIYYGADGKIKKETSWKGWCDSKIPSVEFDNTPRNNYVFNKGIQRYGDWGSGRSVVRVYDPRDFEFEISVDNLIGILMHSDVSKRDIVEECVFAWAGPELVLLPVNSEEYRKSVEYTDKQDKKISAKTLKKGFWYSQKKSNISLMYMGYYQYYNQNSYRYEQEDKGKRHVFHDGNNFIIPSVGTLAEEITTECDENYASILEKFYNSKHAERIVDFMIEKSELNDKFNSYDTRLFFKENDEIKYLTGFDSREIENLEYVSIMNCYITLCTKDSTNGIKLEEKKQIHNSYYSYSAGDRLTHSRSISDKCKQLFEDIEKLQHVEYYGYRYYSKEELISLIKHYEFDNDVVGITESDKKVKFRN